MRHPHAGRFLSARLESLIWLPLRASSEGAKQNFYIVRI